VLSGEVAQSGVEASNHFDRAIDASPSLVAGEPRVDGLPDHGGRGAFRARGAFLERLDLGIRELQLHTSHVRNGSVRVKDAIATVEEARATRPVQMCVVGNQAAMLLPVTITSAGSSPGVASRPAHEAAAAPSTVIPRAAVSSA